MVVFMAWEVELIPMAVKKSAASLLIIVAVMLHNGGFCNGCIVKRI
jgi:hypothetical protein